MNQCLKIILFWTIVRGPLIRIGSLNWFLPPLPPFALSLRVRLFRVDYSLPLPPPPSLAVVSPGEAKPKVADAGMTYMLDRVNMAPMQISWAIFNKVSTPFDPDIIIKGNLVTSDGLGCVYIQKCLWSKCHHNTAMRHEYHRQNYFYLVKNHYLFCTYHKLFPLFLMFSYLFPFRTLKI